VHAPPPEDPRAPGDDDAAADARMRLLLADLRRRLRPACPGWSEDAFEALVREIAVRKARWGEATQRH
jgi:hypothetical protein